MARSSDRVNIKSVLTLSLRVPISCWSCPSCNGALSALNAKSILGSGLDDIECRFLSFLSALLRTARSSWPWSSVRSIPTSHQWWSSSPRCSTPTFTQVMEGSDWLTMVKLILLVQTAASAWTFCRTGGVQLTTCQPSSRVFSPWLVGSKEYQMINNWLLSHCSAL